MNTRTPSRDNGLQLDTLPGRGSWWTRHQGVVATILVALTLVIAASWLVFPYFVKGHNLISTVGGNVKQEKLRNAISIGQFLNRTTFG